MSQSVISDNWSLQDIAQLFTSGLDESDTSYLIIDRIKDRYGYEPVSRAGVSSESLFDFLTDIILRDQIIVDEQFINTWKDLRSPLDLALKEKVIKPFSFLDAPRKLDSPRQELLNRLCTTSDLKKHQRENEIGWSKNKTPPYPFLSQIIWGGAGMLARCLVYEKCYTPHPIRKKLLIDSGISIASEDSATTLKNLINEKRVQLASANIGHDQLHSLRIVLPPLPISVIRESSSIQDLIPVALQLRNEHKELRDWLRQYQNAISSDVQWGTQKFEKILKSISSYVDTKMGIVDPNSSTFCVSIGVLKISKKGRPIETLKNQFGIRSIINKLIINEEGQSELAKYLNFFGHKKTAVGLKVVDHFSEK